MLKGQPKVIYGGGDQPLRFVPVDRRGRPTRVTSATFVIVDTDEGEDSSDRTVASGSATLGAVNTTTSAACGQGTADARLVPLTSATGVDEGRSFLLANASVRHLVTVAGVSGSNIYTHHPVPAAFASGATFQSIELEATFPQAVANDEERIQDGDRFQVIWSYSLEGEDWVTGQTVDFRRYSGEAWLTEADMFVGMPLLADRMRNRIRPADCITLATQDLIAELESSGAVAENYRSNSVGLHAIRFRAVAYALRWLGSDGDKELAETYDNRWERLAKGLVQGPGGKAVKLSQEDDQAVNPRIDGFFVKP